MEVSDLFRGQVLVANDLSAYLIEASSAEDFSGCRGGSLGHGSRFFFSRSGSRGTTTAVTAAGAATAGGLTAIAAAVAATAALRSFVEIDLDPQAAQVIKEVEDWGAARFAATAAIIAAVLVAAGRFAALRFTAGRFTALVAARCTGLFAASRFAALFAAGRFTAVTATAALLAFEEALQAGEQVALRCTTAAAIAAFFAAGRFAALLFAASRFPALLFAASPFAALFFAAGRLAALFAAGGLTTATATAATSAQKVVQKFKAKTLANQDDAQQERSKYHVSFHRATSPLHRT